MRLWSLAGTAVQLDSGRCREVVVVREEERNDDEMTCGRDKKFPFVQRALDAAWRALR